jgi:hypothetical protein
MRLQAIQIALQNPDLAYVVNFSCIHRVSAHDRLLVNVQSHKTVLSLRMLTSIAETAQ